MVLDDLGLHGSCVLHTTSCGPPRRRPGGGGGGGGASRSRPVERRELRLCASAGQPQDRRAGTSAHGMVESAGSGRAARSFVAYRRSRIPSIVALPVHYPPDVCHVVPRLGVHAYVVSKLSWRRDVALPHTMSPIPSVPTLEGLPDPGLSFRPAGPSPPKHRIRSSIVR